jgi:hypothetical protein
MKSFIEIPLFAALILTSLCNFNPKSTKIGFSWYFFIYHLIYNYIQVLYKVNYFLLKINNQVLIGCVKFFNIFLEIDMAVNKTFKHPVYGLKNGLQGLPPDPIVAQRDPGVNDKAELSTMWINEASNSVFILTSFSGGDSIWTAASGGGGGSGIFTDVDITGGAGTVLTVDAGGDTDLGGDLDVSGNTGLSGDLSVSLDTTLTGNMSVGLDSTLTGNLSVGLDSTLTGNLSVGLDTTLTGNLSVGLDSTLTGNLDVLGNLIFDNAQSPNPVTISSTDNAANCIDIAANGGTSESVRIRSIQGTGATAVSVSSPAGGYLVSGLLDSEVNVTGLGHSLTLRSLQGPLVLSSFGAPLALSAGASDMSLTANGNLTITSNGVGSVIINNPVGTPVSIPEGINIGVKVISGAGTPNAVVTAAQGSLFLRTDGSSTSTRAYINTDGATAWTNLVTAA